MKNIQVEQIDFTSEEYKIFKEKLDVLIGSQTKEEKAEIEHLSLKIKMESYLEDRLAEEKGLGEFILDFLKNVGISQSRLASQIEIRPSNLNKILKGDRRLNMALAIQIGDILDLDPSLLIQIQAKNELNQFTRMNTSKRNKINYKDLIK